MMTSYINNHLDVKGFADFGCMFITAGIKEK